MYSQIIKDITTELINNENVVINVDDLCLIDYDNNDNNIRMMRTRIDRKKPLIKTVC
ncbi:hypothetical protein [Monkeypox virus]|uniref:Uncharacterized protein n=1 Tax=Monkeypox virus TaxID=10244 RepID=A0A7G8C4Z0_MONPV|nr:hypothetical protein [Monkeypox virus]